MGKGPSSRAASRHHQFRARAKTRVDDLQEMFSGLQSARKDSRPADAAVLEAQLQQMLREWRSELSAPSPASSLQVPVPSASSDQFRLHLFVARLMVSSVAVIDSRTTPGRCRIRRRRPCDCCSWRRPRRRTTPRASWSSSNSINSSSSRRPRPRLRPQPIKTRGTRWAARA